MWRDPGKVVRWIGADLHRGIRERPQRNVDVHYDELTSALGSKTERRKTVGEFLRSRHLHHRRRPGEQGEVLPSGHELNLVLVVEPLFLTLADHSKQVVVGCV
jgi:hypothetical protein